MHFLEPISGDSGAKGVQQAKELAKKTKRKKEQAAKKKGKKKLKTGKEEAEEEVVEIPSSIKEEYKKSKAQLKKTVAKKPKIKKEYSNVDSVLDYFKRYRSKHPVIWDPVVLEDAPDSSAVYEFFFGGHMINA